MSKLVFTNSTDIKITLHISDSGDHKEIWLDRDKYIDGQTPLETCVFVFRRPTWKDDVEIQDESMEISDGSVRVRPSRLRYRRFVSLLKEWSLNGEDGKTLPITEDTISNIDPDVGNFIMDELDRRLGRL